MKYPITSLAISLLIWSIFFVVVGWVFFKNNHQPDAITIDANLIVTKKNSDHHPKTKAVVQKPTPAKDLAKTKDLIKTTTTRPSSNSNNNHELSDKKASTIYQPLPTIPDELREEAFSTVAIARFHIATDGSATVELIKPCANPKLNHLLLVSLRRWRFTPARHLGVATPSTEDIQVRFKVE